jgi:hypothetical protein
MAASPLNTLAHVFLPNLVKLKGHTAFAQACERKDKSFFAQTWQQAYVEHDPKFHYNTRKNTDGTITYKIGVIDLPKPKDMGDAYMIGVAVRHNDTAYGRLFLLEHDWLMKTNTNKTVVAEREGHGPAARRMAHFDGPPITDNFDTDAAAFVDAFMELIVPTKVKPKR